MCTHRQQPNALRQVPFFTPLSFWQYDVSDGKLPRGRLCCVPGPGPSAAAGVWPDSDQLRVTTQTSSRSSNLLAECDRGVSPEFTGECNYELGGHWTVLSSSDTANYPRPGRES